MKQGGRLETPENWPRHIHRPLVLAQADDVLAAFSVGGKFLMAVTVRCTTCGTFVAEVTEVLLDESPDGEFCTTVGALFRGTVRTTSRRFEMAKRYGRKGRVDLADYYLACLETPSAAALPANLPLWCNREHRERTISQARVRRALAKARDNGEEEHIRA